MPKFSAASNIKLMTCHPDLVRLFRAVVVDYDCTILDGARTESDQLDKIKRGLSKVTNVADSKHVVSDERPLSDAVDAAPYPVIWPDSYGTTADHNHQVGRFYHFAGYVKAKANELGIKIRWGGDWNSDGTFTDQKFDDLDHFERVE